MGLETWVIMCLEIWVFIQKVQYMGQTPNNKRVDPGANIIVNKDTKKIPVGTYMKN